MPVRLTPVQSAVAQRAITLFAVTLRRAAITDQDMAELVLSVGARWLAAHGVAAASIHQWIDRELALRSPVPLIAAARSPNDFGGSRQ